MAANKNAILFSVLNNSHIIYKNYLFLLCVPSLLKAIIFQKHYKKVSSTSEDLSNAQRISRNRVLLIS